MNFPRASQQNQLSQRQQYNVDNATGWQATKMNILKWGTKSALNADSEFSLWLFGHCVSGDREKGQDPELDDRLRKWMDGCKQIQKAT